MAISSLENIDNIVPKLMEIGMIMYEKDISLDDYSIVLQAM